MLMDFFKNLRYTEPQEDPAMANHIHDHEIDYAIQKPTPNTSGYITPKFIVMHYTAGKTASSAIQTFQSSASRVSAHLTIDLDGTVYQHAPFNVKTWHAGPSRYMGYSGLNSHAIGIEIVNVGWLRKGQNSYYRDGLKMPFSTEVVAASNARVGSGTFYWPTYPDIQMDSVQAITEDIIESYGILDIVSHEEIDTRGWKTDPGPAFDMQRFKQLLKGTPHRDLDNDRYEVTASSLNVRSGPGTQFGVIAGLKRGSIVNDLGRNGDWVRVTEDGWTHGAYLRRVS